MVAFCIQTLLFAVHRHVGSPPINTIETVWKVKTKIIRPRKTAFRFWKNPKLPISSRISSVSIITLNNCLAMLFSFQATWDQALFFSGFFGSRAKKNNSLLPKTNHKVDHRERAWSQLPSRLPASLAWLSPCVTSYPVGWITQCAIFWWFHQYL